MPQGNLVIYDTLGGQYLTYFSTVLENCLWGSAQDALTFTQTQVDYILASWGDQGGRFIGKNPPPR